MSKEQEILSPEKLQERLDKLDQAIIVAVETIDDLKNRTYTKNPALDLSKVTDDREFLKVAIKGGKKRRRIIDHTIPHFLERRSKLQDILDQLQVSDTKLFTESSVQTDTLTEAKEDEIEEFSNSDAAVLIGMLSAHSGEYKHDGKSFAFILDEEVKGIIKRISDGLQIGEFEKQNSADITAREKVIDKLGKIFGSPKVIDTVLDCQECSSEVKDFLVWLYLRHDDWPDFLNFLKTPTVRYTESVMGVPITTYYKLQAEEPLMPPPAILPIQTKVHTGDHCVDVEGETILVHDEGDSSVQITETVKLQGDALEAQYEQEEIANSEDDIWKFQSSEPETQLEIKNQPVQLSKKELAEKKIRREIQSYLQRMRIANIDTLDLIGGNALTTIFGFKLYHLAWAEENLDLRPQFIGNDHHNNYTPEDVVLIVWGLKHKKRFNPKDLKKLPLIIEEELEAFRGAQ